MNNLFSKLIAWLLKLLSFLRIIKPQQNTEDADSSDENADSFNDGSSTVPATKDELRKLDAKHVHVERRTSFREATVQDFRRSLPM